MFGGNVFQLAGIIARRVAARMAPERVTVVSADMAWQQTTLVQVFLKYMACLAKNFNQIFIYVKTRRALKINHQTGYGNMQ